MGEYYITRTFIGEGHRLPITDEDFEEINQAVDVQWDSLYLEQKYDFVIENYIELEEDLMRSGLEHMLLNLRDRQKFNIERALFDRRIMNLLTTFKSYEDSYVQHINVISKRDSQIREKAKAAFSTEYDERIGYRTMAKLRNFIQHQGLPVHGSTYQSKWLPDTEDQRARARYTVDPHISTVELRKGNFNRDVLADLEAIGEKVDMKTLLRDFLEGFSNAHYFNRNLLKERIEWSSAVIEKWIERYLEGTPAKTRTAISAVSVDESSNRTRVYLNNGAEEHRAYLTQKNGPLVHLTKRYVSSEIVG